MKKAWRLVLAASALLLFTGIARDARSADSADEADLQFQLGAEKYEAADYKGALEHFLASNRLVPNRNVLFNIARTFEQLKQNSDAYRYYVQALDGETNPGARQRVEQAIKRISPQVAIIRVETDPPGATVYIDRKDLGPRGSTPRPLSLPPGSHKVIVELPGYEPAESPPVDMKIGSEIPVSLKLTQIVGTVHVEGSPSGASVRIDRDESPIVGHIPCDIAVPPGRHTLIVSRDGFQSSDVPAEVVAKQTTTVRARLTAQTGNVVVNADVRDALITVDDQPSGFTPAVLNIPVGVHKVKIAQSGFRPVEQTIDVKPNQQTKVDLQLASLEEVTAASRVSESVEDAPASVTIINGQELRAMGYPTIAEAVRGIRGLYLSDDRSYTTVGFRGFSRPGDYGNRILVLVDGHPTNDNYIWSSYVGFDGRVDIDDVDRIEVVRGPGSVLYGTGAFFGVINLITRDKNAPTHGELAASAVDYGVGRVRATAQWRATPYAGVWNSVAMAHGTGRDMYFPEYVSADPANPELDANGRPADGNARGVDGFNAATVNGRAWYKALTLQWFLTTRKKQLPTGEYGSTFNDPRTNFTDTRGFVEGRFEPQVTKQVQLLSRAHFNIYNFDDLIAFPVNSGAPGDTNDGPQLDTYRGKWGGVEQRVVYTPTDIVRITAGGEVIQHFQTLQKGRTDSSSFIQDNGGNLVPSRDDPFTVGAAYGLADVTPMKRFKISAGARLDYYSNLDKFELLPAFNPRLAFIIKPYDKGNLKILGGKAFRAPSVYELHYSSPSQVLSQDLQPEQIYSGEVEFTHRFSSTVTATVAGYANYVKDLIELQDVATSPGGPLDHQQYRNSDAPVLVLGSEYEVRREWRQGWMVAASYSLQKARYLNDSTLGNVPNSPMHLASFKGAVPIIGKTLMAMSRVSLEGPRPDGNYRAVDPPQRYTDTGVIWDLVLSGEVENMHLRYAIGAYNVADWRYDTVPSGEFRQRTIVQNGRTFLASGSVTF